MCTACFSMLSWVLGKKQRNHFQMNWINILKNVKYFTYNEMLRESGACDGVGEEKKLSCQPLCHRYILFILLENQGLYHGSYCLYPLNPTVCTLCSNYVHKIGCEPSWWEWKSSLFLSNPSFNDFLLSSDFLQLVEMKYHLSTGLNNGDAGSHWPFHKGA